MIPLVLLQLSAQFLTQERETNKIKAKAVGMMATNIKLELKHRKYHFEIQKQPSVVYIF